MRICPLMRLQKTCSKIQQARKNNLQFTSIRDAGIFGLDYGYILYIGERVDSRTMTSQHHSRSSKPRGAEPLLEIETCHRATSTAALDVLQQYEPLPHHCITAMTAMMGTPSIHPHRCCCARLRMLQAILPADCTSFKKDRSFPTWQLSSKTHTSCN